MADETEPRDPAALPSADVGQPEPLPTAPAAPEPMPGSAFIALVMVARHHGLPVDPDALQKRHKIGDWMTARQIRKVARDIGMVAKVRKLRGKPLEKWTAWYPAVAPLKRGGAVVLCGITPTAQGGVAVVRDPQRMDMGFIGHALPAWDAMSNGEVIMLRRRYPLQDATQPFGLRWFIPEILRQKAMFRDVALASIFLTFLGLALPMFTQLVLDKVLIHHAMNTLNVLGVGVGVAILLEAMFGYIRNYMVLLATNKIDTRITSRTFGRLLSLPMDFFERASAGVLVKNMSSTGSIREFLTGRLFFTFLDMVALFIFFPVMLMYSGELSLIVLVYTALIASILLAMVPPFKRRLLKLYEADSSQQSLLVETIQGIRTVKSLSLDARQRVEWNRRVMNAVKTRYEVGKISAIGSSIVGMLDKFMQATIVAYGAHLVFEGRLLIGGLIAFQMLSGRVSGPLIGLVGLIHQYQETALSVRMLSGVMNTPSERPEGAPRGAMPPIQGAVSFQNVSFRYLPTLPLALDNVSFHVPAGKILGIMGRSGSGKTTVTRLIQALHQVHAGQIKLDQYDLRELDLQHLRSVTGVVLQDSFLFRGTVRDNISAGKPDATFEEIMEAARMAGADEFIERLPRGFDTLLEEGSANLSGGQRQRLAIARALICRPRVLIFDEATSALDAESEAIIQANLHRIAEGRTMIIVSHRLSALVEADSILVMDQGKVVDQGTHQELLGRCKIYQQLWRQQTMNMAAH